MFEPKEVNKVQSQFETTPLRFRVDKLVYVALKDYAKENGFLTGQLAKAIITKYVNDVVLKKKAEAVQAEWREFEDEVL